MYKEVLIFIIITYITYSIAIPVIIGLLMMVLYSSRYQAMIQRMDTAAELKPKFDIVLNTLESELGGTGLAQWTSPKGGYFVAIDTLDNCARATLELAKQAGVTMTGAGATFPYHRDPRDRNIRIAPTYPTADELQTAIRLFCVCVKLAGVRKLIAEKQ